jgi:hypothetical protein
MWRTILGQQIARLCAGIVKVGAVSIVAQPPKRRARPRPELEQFAVDAWRASKRIFDAHPPDQDA